jgi:PAS domain S-box-containing protein
MTGNDKKNELTAGEMAVLYKDFVENARDLIQCVDSEGKFVFVNQAWLSTLGYAADDIKNITLWDIIHPDSMEHCMAVFEQVLTGKAFGEVEAVFIANDGTPVMVEGNIGVKLDERGRFVHTRGIFHDVTKRRELEEALRKSEKRYRFLSENMGDVVWTMDLDLNTTYISPSTTKVFGFNPEERLQQKIDQIMPPQSLAYIMQRFQEEMAKEQHGKVEQDRQIIVEAEFYHKNGGIVWMENLVKAIRDKDGKPIGIYGSSRDITERKRAEEALRESEERLDLAMAVKNEGIWDVNLTSNETYYDDRYYTMAGYQPGDFPQDSAAWEERVHEEDLPIVQKAIENHLNGKSANIDIEYRLKKKDGQWMWVNDKGKVYERDESGKPVRIVGTHTDITDRKLAEEALQVSEVRFQRMLKVIPDMISVHDPDMNIVYSNWAGFAAMPPEKQVLNTKCYKTYRDYDQICPDCQAVTVLDSKVAFQGEFELSEGYWIDLRVFPLLDSSGEVEYFIEWVRDISALKKIEDQLKKFNIVLDEKVQERTIQLEALNKELASFAYSISHDFRAPLRALDAFSASLNDKYGDQIDEQGRHYISRIRNNALYMSDLIDDLLKLSRITRADVNPQEVDISRLAGERIQLLQETEPERRVEVKIAAELSARGDRALLHAALQNLLENAWKFSSQEAQAEIEVGRTTIAGEEVFFVRDNGVGFNMAYADKLFGTFQRLHGADEFPGTGIGLATVQRIINRHGGKIWAESEIGKGATFYFTLEATKMKGRFI